jgi:hypothetical protein
MNKTLLLAAASTLSLNIGVVPVAAAGVMCPGNERAKEFKMSGLDMMTCKMVPDVETWQPSVCDWKLNFDCILSEDGTVAKRVEMALINMPVLDSFGEATSTYNSVQELIYAVSDSFGEATSNSTLILTVEEEKLQEAGDEVPCPCPGYVYRFLLADLKEGKLEVMWKGASSEEGQVETAPALLGTVRIWNVLAQPLAFYPAVDVINVLTKRTEEDCGPVCLPKVFPSVAMVTAGAWMIGYLRVIGVDDLVLEVDGSMVSDGDLVVVSVCPSPVALATRSHDANTYIILHDHVPLNTYQNLPYQFTPDQHLHIDMHSLVE